MNTPAVFYITISSLYVHTVEPNTALLLTVVPKALSLSPTVVPNASHPFTPGTTTVLSISFSCVNSEDGGAVTATIVNLPFAPTTFQFFKQCRT